MDVMFRDEGTHLVAVCQGTWDPVAVTEAAKRILTHAKQLSHDRLLIDWMQISAPASEEFRRLAGEDVAFTFAAPMRVGILYRENLISGVAQKVATDYGANILITHDQAHLVSWLIQATA
jgi:hypothetical protein